LKPIALVVQTEAVLPCLVLVRQPYLPNFKGSQSALPCLALPCFALPCLGEVPHSTHRIEGVLIGLRICGYFFRKPRRTKKKVFGEVVRALSLLLTPRA
jgi:hypothetical protein